MSTVVRPMPVGSEPFDETHYDVTDCAGNLIARCSSLTEAHEIADAWDGKQRKESE